MKQAEVPQDASPVLGPARRALYAVDESGHYTTVASNGWRMDAIVTEQAIDEYQRLAREALARAHAGLSSPLEFHMYDRRLEPPALAQAAGLWQWRVRRHLRPEVFAKLDERVLRRYAEAMGLGVDALRSLPAPGALDASS